MPNEEAEGKKRHSQPTIAEMFAAASSSPNSSNSKRHKPDFDNGPVTMEELKELIIAENEKTRSEVNVGKKELKIEIENVAAEQNALKESVEENAKVVTEVKIELNGVKAKINALSQGYLEPFMDISGLPSSEILSGKPLKQIVVDLLWDMLGISKKENGVFDVSLRTKSTNGESIYFLVVRFSSLHAKNYAMQRKLSHDKGKNDISIFFSHSLTPTNRALLWQARNAAKGMRDYRAYYAAGRIFIKKNGAAKGTPVMSTEDIRKFVEKETPKPNLRFPGERESTMEYEESEAPISTISHPSISEEL